MAITAFSKRFNRELDVKQLQNLYQQLLNDLDPSDFIKTDIECPCCGVTGGRIVSEGISPKTNLVVKQAHFAFKNDNGVDAHLVFCDYYSGNEPQNRTADDSIINLPKSGNEVTQAIRQLVCRAIHNNIFQQKDIRNMRQWFFDMRSTHDFLVEISKHQLNILRKSVSRSERNREQYTIDQSILNKDWFDLDEEVYESLATKFPFPSKVKEINGLSYFLVRKGTLKKAISLSQKNHGSYEFDRNRLEKKYRLATKLSLDIIGLHALFYHKIGNSVSKARSNNPLMAYSATLLFVNNWNVDGALEMHNNIVQSNTVVDENLGNVIGLNPFMHYDAWIALQFTLDWKKEFAEYDFDEEYLKERERLKVIYEID